MTRLATTLDRFAAFLFGLALIALGVGLAVWNTDWIPGLPKTITAPGLVTAASTTWWPWASAGAGLVLVLVAIRWLLVHTPKSRIKALRLSTGDAGSISADLGEVANAAARALEQCPDVQSAKGKAVVDRGTRTIDLVVTARSPESVAAVTGSIDAVNGQIAGVLGEDTVATRTSIHFEKHPRRARVE